MANRIFLFLSFFCAQVFCEPQAQCKEVRLADIGWTDVTSTTAIAAELLHALGYQPKVSVLSTPVTLAGLKNNDMDVFMGNWMPTQEADIRPYLDEGSVVQLQKNLSGARYTLAVPKYVYDAGVKSFADLSREREKFNGEIYGIEPGNDGNRLLLDIIKKNDFDLGSFNLVESSEQGMLVEVAKAVQNKDWIVFLAWSPHPMNLSHEIEYLSGGDEYFGANFGESYVFTATRRNFANDCTNLAVFFRQLIFSVEIESQIMNLILTQKLNPQEAAQAWLLENQQVARAWLAGVKSYHGSSGEKSLDNYLNVLKLNSESRSFTRLPLGELMESSVVFLTDNFSQQFREFSRVVELVVQGTLKLLLEVPWVALLVSICALVFYARRQILLTIMVAFGLLLIANLGLWVETMQTLVLVVYASLLSIMIGVPLGIWAGHNEIVYKVLRPILDLMQTIPTFVYLIPTLMLFGLGLVPGLISTIIFAVAAPIRLTYLGIKNVPIDLLEACDSFGATKMQRLMKVEIPSAMPSIMAGITQCIMLSLSMVVIAALVGAEGLGTPVVRALNTVNIKQGFESGIAIVILAILLDRVLSARPASSHKGG